MDVRMITFLLITLTTIQAHEPEVYEIVDDQIVGETNTNLRVSRDGETLQRKPKFHQPPHFDYKSASQQDRRQYRYALQQSSDMNNIFGQKININWNKIDQITPKEGRKSRKLSSNKYNAVQNVDRQDNPLIADIPTSGGEELSVLNQLIGLPPNTQLEGLRKLLETPNTRVVLPLVKGPRPFQMKDYTPIVEHTVDIPNPQTRPNVKIDHTPNLNLQKLQAQLDMAAREEADKLLAEAQQKALAQVEAQQQAITKARLDAEQQALAKIAEYNQKPIALALQSGSNTYAPEHNYEPNVVPVEVTTIHPVQIGGLIGNPQVPTGNRLPVDTQIDHNHHNHQYAARYAFGYRIKDIRMGNDFGHEEKREGKSAKGHYHVLLPDGRLQKVDYYADLTGYHAKVTYEHVHH